MTRPRTGARSDTGRASWELPPKWGPQIRGQTELSVLSFRQAVPTADPDSPRPAHPKHLRSLQAFPRGDRRPARLLLPPCERATDKNAAGGPGPSPAASGVLLVPAEAQQM